MLKKISIEKCMTFCFFTVKKCIISLGENSYNVYDFK